MVKGEGTVQLTLGEKLKDLRNQKGLTTIQVCDEILKRYNYNLSNGKYNEMEGDAKKDFGHKTFIYLADFFEVSVDYLLGISNIPSPNIKIKAICKLTGLSEKAVKMLISTTSMSLQQSLDLFEGTTISEIEKEELYNGLGDYPEQLSGCSFILSDFVNMLFNNEELLKTASYFTEANRTAFNGIDEKQKWVETEEGDIIISGPMCRELYISQCVKSFEKIVREALVNAQHNPKNE